MASDPLYAYYAAYHATVAAAALSLLDHDSARLAIVVANAGYVFHNVVSTRGRTLVAECGVFYLFVCAFFSYPLIFASR